MKKVLVLIMTMVMCFTALTGCSKTEQAGNDVFTAALLIPYQGCLLYTSPSPRD